MRLKHLLLYFLFSTTTVTAQTNTSLRGRVTSDGKPVPFASVGFANLKMGVTTDEQGEFRLTGLPAGQHTLQVTAVGYVRKVQPLRIKSGDNIQDIVLEATSASLNEVVVSGTLKAVSKMESPVPVEVYAPVFFRRNPTPVFSMRCKISMACGRN
ncbi:carboxypeptidase-like regulatory domain-containing protein [Chitinophaga sedimenti]|uniref:carboxypeptidase-like regulatory domain-containing protein n=1 Tax=Chitinophaga sedimenti TaxID=2033606 RepID=UPI0020051106|nr:carboxypeptidase-like regulatory domain-containing protein [Chitinophaga sedimenti]MCK7558305.1 carboxypeptidase-like regulatory domain-containing protein [Chitinophaga sedimenti]